MKKNLISTSLILATVSAMSSVANAEELKKNNDVVSTNNSEIKELDQKQYLNIAALKQKWNIQESIHTSEIEAMLNKKVVALAISENISTITDNYGEDKLAKQEIFENLVLGACTTNCDSSDIKGFLGTTPVQTNKMTTTQSSNKSFCHGACHGACHNACHGSRGWR